MWSAVQHALVSLLDIHAESSRSQSAVTGAAALLAAYAGYRVLSGVVEELSIQRALDKQKLYRPASTLPVLGNTLDVMIYQKDRFHDWLAEQTRASGGRPWVLSILGRATTLVVTSPELCEDIFKTQFDIFPRGPAMLDMFHDFVGKGIAGVDGEEWAQQRRTYSHLFSMQMLRDVMDEVVMEKTERWCDVLAASARTSTPVKMKSLVSKFTSDVFTKVGFGVELRGLENSLKGDLSDEHPFIKAIENYGVVWQARAQSPTWFWKLKRYLNIGDEAGLKKNAAIVLDLVREIMLKSLSSKNTEDEAKSHRDLLSMFLESSGTKDATLARDMVVNFFLAGYDTTSFSMSWFIVNMNRYPRVLQKIREEIRTTLPDLGKRVPTLDEIQKLPYLEAAIRENLRLYMTGVYRTPSRSTTLFDGTFVPFGTGVMMSAYAAGRQPTIWGPDVDKFRPERFIDEATGKLKAMSPYKFISFIGGPRQCLGVKFAMLEMKTAMATLFHRFDLVTVEDPFSITYDMSLVLPVKGDLLVDARERLAEAA